MMLLEGSQVIKAEACAGQVLPAMMSLETDTIRPGDSTCNPDLSNIMGFCSSWITFHDVLKLASEDLAIGITGNTCWFR